MKKYFISSCTTNCKHAKRTHQMVNCSSTAGLVGLMIRVDTNQIKRFWGSLKRISGISYRKNFILRNCLHQHFEKFIWSIFLFCYLQNYTNAPKNTLVKNNVCNKLIIINYVILMYLSIMLNFLWQLSWLNMLTTSFFVAE